MDKQVFFQKFGTNISISDAVSKSYKNIYNVSELPLIFNGVSCDIECKVFKYLKDNCLNVLFAGRFEYQKGINELIKVVLALKDNSNYYFHIIGDGSEKEKLIKELSMQSNVSIYPPLFGLSDYKFETLATLMHSHHLDKKFGVGPHTISVPRIEHAEGVAFSDNPPAQMSDISFKKLVAVIRLSVPYTGLILSTREKPQMRRDLLDLGISQISAESKTNPGGYKLYKSSAEQFEMADNRPLDGNHLFLKQ